MKIQFITKDYSHLHAICNRKSKFVPSGMICTPTDTISIFAVHTRSYVLWITFQVFFTCGKKFLPTGTNLHTAGVVFHSSNWIITQRLLENGDKWFDRSNYKRNNYKKFYHGTPTYVPLWADECSNMGRSMFQYGPKYVPIWAKNVL